GDAEGEVGEDVRAADADLPAAPRRGDDRAGLAVARRGVTEVGGEDDAEGDRALAATLEGHAGAGGALHEADGGGPVAAAHHVVALVAGRLEAQLPVGAHHGEGRRGAAGGAV